METKGTIAALDIGTSEVKLIVGELLGGTLNVLAEGSAPSAGVKRGVIVDIDQTVNAIKQAVTEVERTLGEPIGEVYVAISGEHIQVKDCQGMTSIKGEDNEITDDDVKDVLHSAMVMRIPNELSVVDVLPKTFTVDQQTEITDPRGMIGYRLEVTGKLIIGAKTILHSIKRSIERAGLELAGYVLESLAVSRIAASIDELELGVGIVDIGHETTTLSIYEKNDLVYSTTLAYGGDHLTRDLTYKMNCKYQDAKLAKEEYGVALEALGDPEEKVSYVTINGEHRFEPQTEIGFVLEARLEEIFEMIQKRMTQAGYSQMNSGIILCGGSSSLPGIDQLGKRIFKQNVNVYQPASLGIRHPKYAVAAGMLRYVLSRSTVSKSGFDRADEKGSIAQGREQEELLASQPQAPAREDRKPQEQPPKERKSFSSFFEKFFG
ncbi:cell division protein FtsA [Exiguobacterium sp. RIT452]|jgi:cell division protein FtsA|uniref:cell division protein FtsA n=1 Tax=Exiguobacterium TaxID=33986 RepID=UPI00047D3E21|nr:MULTISPECIES: cell division protein FtsA [Exiguobacterium]RJP00513.1 cell division protein FtsA [Exiguobacterium sp. RIT452]